MKNISKINFAFAFGIAFNFIACGDSTTETEIREVQPTVEIVETSKDLPDCDSTNEGSQIWIKKEGAARLCVEGKWESLSDEPVSEDDYSCRAKALSDSSGFIILCNGDSIGVILNGVDGGKGATGAKGDDGDKGLAGDSGKVIINRAECLIASKTDSTIIIQCGDSNPLEVSLGGSENNPSIKEPESIKDSDDEESDSSYSVDTDISGVSQKGPFLRGAAVTAYELLNGRTLKQTGKSFRGNIDNNEGLFNIKSVKLSSQYAYLEANGTYLNEITGENSNGAIELRAITNLKGRKTANINLMTHLEYNRVVNLVTQSGMGVAAAKRQALRELLNAFEVDTTSLDKNTYSEDLTIFGKTEADAALLAISIMLQGERSAASLKSLLATISYNISETGVWSDLDTKDSILNWIIYHDIIMDSLPQYRKYVENWKFVEKAPDFEKIIRKFAGIHSGLGICGGTGDSSAPIGSFRQVTNSELKKYYAPDFNGNNSGAKIRFVCAEGSNNQGPKWRLASTIEKDTANWSKTNFKYFEGMVQKGRVTDTMYIYSAKLNQWRTATQNEYDTYHYKDSTDWTADTVDGAFKIGEKTGAYYVFDSKNGGWRIASTVMDYSNGIDGCTKAKENSRARSQIEADNNVYHCILDQENENYKWEKETDVLINDTYGETCPETAGQIFKGKVNNTNKYVCSGTNTFREANRLEIILDKGCTEEVSSTTYAYNQTKWNCKDLQWTWDGQAVSGTLEDTRDGNTRFYKTTSIGLQTWMAENLNYETENDWCGCGPDNSEDCNLYGRLYTWETAVAYDAENNGFDPQGICPEEWHIPSYEEFDTLLSIVSEKYKNTPDRRTTGTTFPSEVLRTTKYWEIGDENDDRNEGTDQYGFSVVPSGIYNMSYGHMLNQASYWTSTEKGGQIMSLYFNENDLGFNWLEDDSYYGRSVRCIKNQPNQ